MTKPGTAVVTVESNAERPAIPYELRSPSAAILNTDQARAAIMPFIPAGTRYETVLAEVHRAAVNNPEILKCKPESVIQAVGQAVQTGLVIGKTIHLVPVSGKLQAWTDYKGDIELVLWSGAARHVDAKCVYEKDHFEYELGDSPWLKHRPAGLDPKKRGKLIGGYCIAWLNGSGTLKKIVVMSLDEVEKVRAKSRAWAPKDHPACPDWYVEKTCIHKNCKTLPKNRRLASVIAMMDAREAHDRGDEIETGNPLELDPTQRVTMSPSEVEHAIDAGRREFESNSSTSSDVAKEEAGPSAAAAFRLPFGKHSKGTPIGDLDPQTLLDAYNWAREQTDDETQYPGFIAAAEALFAERQEARERESAQ